MRIVEVKNLSKKFDEIHAVDDLDLAIDEGEIYGLLGPNGAGKSTFIRLLMKALRPDQGNIHIFGKSVEHHSLEIKSDLGIVPQDLAIYTDLTAEENVSFFASLYGLKGKILKERVAEALGFVGMLEHAKKYPKTFSGGMKRRLNIACALAHHPRLLILDEPTVGVDPQSRYKIISSIKKLHDQGMTIIYTSHYMEEIEALCTKVGIIDHGKLIAEGKVDALESIVTDRSTTLIEVKDSRSISEALLSDIKSVRGIIKVTFSERTLSIDSLKETDNLETLLSLLIENKVGIKDIQLEKVSLETVFLNLTGRGLRD